MLSDRSAVDSTSRGVDPVGSNDAALQQALDSRPVTDELTDRGVVEAGRVYETPNDGVTPAGPEAIFVESDLFRIFAAIETFKETASV